MERATDTEPRVQCVCVMVVLEGATVCNNGSSSIDCMRMYVGM